MHNAQSKKALRQFALLAFLSLTVSLLSGCASWISPASAVTTPTSCPSDSTTGCTATATAGANATVTNGPKPTRTPYGTPAPTATAVPTATPSPNGEIVLNIEAGQAGRAISPYIYGVAYAYDYYITKAGIQLNRWGGNLATRYNWELGNALNTGRYPNFSNSDNQQSSEQDKKPSGAADKFIADSTKAGSSVLMTIPAMGYVAKDSKSQSGYVPKRSGQAINPNGAITGYDPATNREATSLPLYPRKNAAFQFPPNLNDNAVYADEWLNHLVKTFGTASNNGVKFYAIDNEPDLWSETHTDVSPALMGYDALLKRYLEYANVVREQDPSAKILGPVLSSPSRLNYSPLDAATGNADRRAHGDQPFIEWWLSQLRANDEKKNQRTLDVLDVHYYPGSELYPGEKTSNDAQRKNRLEATRALWDKNYRDPGSQANLGLIPRLRDIIDRNYPGTQIGISEWNFGGEQDISGGLAVADALGIFGQQDVYLASYWYFPNEGTPGFFAFKMYGNYNDVGGRFGDLSLGASSNDLSRVAVYASKQTGSGKLTLMVINKTATTQESIIRLQQGDDYANQTVRPWRYEQKDLNGIRPQPETQMDGSNLKVNLPAYSVTLFEVEKKK